MTDADSGERTVTACVVLIGNEILSGRTQDLNLQHLATALNEFGVQVREARVIPDLEAVIIDTVNAVRSQFDWVFTTGGIGPTHDDITADCIAAAFGVPLVMDPGAEALIRKRPAPDDVMEARLRMARIPEGASLVDNPMGGPPGFQIGNVFVLAGVPVVMQAMASTLRERLDGGRPVRSRSVTALLSEGQVAAGLRAIQDRHPGIDLGSYPFFRKDRYGTQLVMRGTDEAALAQMEAEVAALVEQLGGTATDGDST